jgi:hypothetical protein
MSKHETLRYEMFLRVSEFGKSRRQQFPESSPAGQAFAAVAAAAAKFDTHASARRLADEDSRKVKANVSRAIRRRLTLVARAARLVATSTPDDISRFTLPAGQSAEALLTAARVFVRDGHVHLERFVPLGVPRTIVADLQALVDRFDEADRTWRTGQTARTAAADGINEAIKAGLDAIRTLDVIVPNTADDDPVLDASWRRARRTGRKVRTSPPKPADQPAEAVVAPPADVLPATAGTEDGLRRAS